MIDHCPGNFSLLFDPYREFASVELLRGRTDPLHEDEAAHVVDNIG